MWYEEVQTAEKSAIHSHRKRGQALVSCVRTNKIEGSGQQRQGRCYRCHQSCKLLFIYHELNVGIFQGSRKGPTPKDPSDRQGKAFLQDC